MAETSTMTDPRINLNTASHERLRAIKGIGDATARNIIAIRGEDGTSLTMEGLVTQTRLSRSDILQWYREGLITLTVPDDDLQSIASTSSDVTDPMSSQAVIMQQLRELTGKYSELAQALEVERKGRAEAVRALEDRANQWEGERQSLALDVEYYRQEASSRADALRRSEQERIDLEDERMTLNAKLNRARQSLGEPLGYMSPLSKGAQRYTSRGALMGAYGGISSPLGPPKGLKPLATPDKGVSSEKETGPDVKSEINPSEAGPRVTWKLSPQKPPTRMEPAAVKVEPPGVTIRDDPGYSAILGVLHRREVDTEEGLSRRKSVPHESNTSRSKVGQTTPTQRPMTKKHSIIPRPSRETRHRLDSASLPSSDGDQELAEHEAREDACDPYQREIEDGYDNGHVRVAPAPAPTIMAQRAAAQGIPHRRVRGHYYDEHDHREDDRHDRHRHAHDRHDRDRHDCNLHDHDVHGRDRHGHDGRGRQRHHNLNRRPGRTVREADHWDRRYARVVDHDLDSDLSDDDLTGSDTSADFSSEEESPSSSDDERQYVNDDRRGWRRGQHRRARHHRRQRSPPAPKMNTFSGDPKEWRPFMYQFSQVAKNYQWSRRMRLQRLSESMRDKAVTYMHSLPYATRSDYKELKKALNRRYGQRDPPSYARRKAFTIKQLEQESIEDFSDRALRIVMDGFPQAPDDIVQQLAVESFLHGCKDKTAAYLTSEKKPRSLRRALKYMKDTMQNMQSFGKHALSSRQVTFDLPGSSEEVAVRAVAPHGGSTTPPRVSRSDEHRHPSRSDEHRRSSQIDTKELAREISSSLATSLQKLICPPARNRSASPSKEGVTCFTCGTKGHYASECPHKRTGSPSRGSSSPSASPSRNVCFTCGQSGHYQRSCPKRDRTPSPSNKETPRSPLKI